MKCFRRTVECLLFGHSGNGDILEELKVETVDESIRKYKRKWLQHVRRMNNNRMTKIMLNYKTNGRRLLRIPLKNLLDEAETGLCRPNW